MKLLTAPSVIMLFVAIIIILIIALPAVCLSTSPAKPITENDDLVPLENSMSERKSVIARKNTKRKSQLDPNYITRVARRSNRDGQSSPNSLICCPRCEKANVSYF